MLDMLGRLARTLIAPSLVPAAALLATSAVRAALPAPTGPFAIGRVTLTFTDSARTEPLAAEPRFRELLIDVWYPADVVVGTEAPYVDPAMLARPENVRDLAYYLRGAAEAVRSGSIRTYAVLNAPFARTLARAPLLIFSHGGGEMRETYAAQLLDLASHGYVVAAVTHPYDAALALFPDGRRVRYAPSRWPPPTVASIEGLPPDQEPSRERLRWWADDLRFVLDALTREGDPVGAPFHGRIDPTRIGAFGHSAGGLAAAQACQLDARFRACLDQDGLAAGTPYFLGADGWGMDQPFMVIVRALPSTPPSDAELAKMGMTRAQAEALSWRLRARREAALRSTGGSYWLELDAAATTHADFGDLPLLQAVDEQDAARRVRVIGAVRRYTRAFFDAALVGASPAFLAEAAADPLVTSVQRYAAGTRPAPAH